MTHAAIDLMTADELTRAKRDDDEACFGSLSTARGHLPLEAMEVVARIVGLSSRVELKQTFVNTIDEPIEATYIFPLPDRAAVTKFRMQIGERVVEGVIKERGAARVEYDAAIQAGHQAAITEEERPGVFTMRVGNLRPGEIAIVQLTMSGPLPLEEGDVTFRFPLVVAPRYIPGNPLTGESVGDGIASDTDAVPDASRITPPVLLPGYPNPVRLSLKCDIDPAGLPITSMRSSLHTVVDSEAEGGRRVVELQPGERLNRDFILRFGIGDEAVRTSLTLTPDGEAEGEGTFALTLVPPVIEGAAPRPRDVIFVLDRSGSMGGWKMVAARRAVGRMVDTLNDSDRFTVYAFDNVVESPPVFNGPDLVPASDRNRYRAIEFLSALDARGGTEMAMPLTRAAERLAGGYQDRDRVLVLVTDGQVGNESQILRSLKKKLKNVRIFTLGIDRAVNEGFLKRLAVMGGGACELVESEDRLDDVMDKIHRRIGNPVITELALEAKGITLDSDTIVPHRIPDLFTGSPVVIRGRYRGQGKGSIVLKGQDAAGSPWEEGIDGREVADDLARDIWARGFVRDLEDQYDAGYSGNRELAAKITSTSLRYRVLCRFTAFLAVDRTVRIEGGEPHKVTQPVEAPDGWSMLDAADSLAEVDMEAAKEAAPEMVMSQYAAAPEPLASAPRSRSAATPMKAAAAVLGAPVGAAAGAVQALGRALRGGGGGGKADASADKKRKQSPAPAAMAPAPPPASPMVRKMPAPKQAEKREEAADAPVELDSYRARLERIGDELRAGASREARARATELVGKLRALIEDLTSVDGPEAWIRALTDLVTALRAALAGDADALNEALARAEKELSDLAADGSGPRREFWK